MGIFTRFTDIVSSNINSMLDKAEDPEKMIKLMIHEMEDTLIELKSSCAGVIAGQKKLERKFDNILEKVELWSKRANLAVSKGRDDLAREALLEKRRFAETAETLELPAPGVGLGHETQGPVASGRRPWETSACCAPKEMVSQVKNAPRKISVAVQMRIPWPDLTNWKAE